MANTSIIGTGLSGLVGSKFSELYKDTYQLTNLDLSIGVDILNEQQVMNAVQNSNASAIIHMAAFTDVNKAFEETNNKDGLTYKVNVLGTRNIVKAAKTFGKYLIHISTSYVFDGNKEGLYNEEDSRHPIEWYGQTKAWAEEEVEQGGAKYAILRIDRPYRLDEFLKLDLLHKVMEKLKTNTLPPQFADTSWTPTSIETFSQWLQQFVEKQPEGIYHTTTEPVFSDYTFALWVKEKYNLSGEVKEGSLTEYLKTSARPYQRNTALDTSKVRKFLGLL
jgi:dTDP-4-dehydrorhamnose reductase